MQKQDVFHNGQTQSRTGHRPLIVVLHRIIPIPYPGKLLGRNSLSRIRHLDTAQAVFRNLTDLHLFILAGIVDGVIDQIVHHLQNPGAVGINKRLPIADKGYFVAVAGAEFTVPFQRPAYRFRQGENFATQLIAGGSRHNGNIRNITDQCAEALRLIDDDLHILRRHLAGNIPHYLAVSRNHGQRCAKIVGNIGDQLLLHRVQMGQLLGGVVQSVAQFRRFPGCTAVEMHVVGTQRQFSCLFTHLRDGAGDVFGDHYGNHRRQKQKDNADQPQLQRQSFPRILRQFDLTVQHDEIGRSLFRTG